MWIDLTITHWLVSRDRKRWQDRTKFMRSISNCWSTLFTVWKFSHHSISSLKRFFAAKIVRKNSNSISFTYHLRHLKHSLCQYVSIASMYFPSNFFPHSPQNGDFDFPPPHFVQCGRPSTSVIFPDPNELPHFAHLKHVSWNTLPFHS